MAGVAVEYILGYQGAPLCYVDSSSAMSIAGNGLCYYSLSGAKNIHVLWGEGFGISAFSYHLQTQYVAYAEKGLKPSVYIHDCRDQRCRLIAKLTDVAELEVSALAFSYHAQRFATASCEPDFRLILWTLHSNSVEKLVEGHMGECVTVDISFNPLNENQLCVLGHGEIYLWTFQSSYRKMSFTCKRFTVGAHVPLCYTWAYEPHMLYTAGQKGQILVFNVGPHELPSGELDANDLLQQALGQVPNTENITSIFVRDTHLLLATDGGHVRWVQKLKLGAIDSGFLALSNIFWAYGGEEKDAAEILKQDFQTLRVLSEIHLPVPDFVSVAYREDGGQVLVGSSDGTLMTLRVSLTLLEHLLQEVPHIDSKGEELKDHDHQAKAQTVGPSQQSQKGKTGTDFKTKPQASVPSQVAQVDWQSTHHAGAILAIGTLRDGKQLVTCGDDGTLRVWDSDKGKELSRQKFNSIQNCLSTHEAACVVATGAENGDVCILKVDSAGLSAPVFWSKVHRCPVDVILFSISSPTLVAASRTDERVFFLQSEAPDWTQLQLLGFALMKDPILSIAWDIQSKGDEDLYLMVSLLRGEIARIKVPLTRAPGGGLVFDTKVIRRISIRTAVPLQSIVVGKYYLEKEGVERRVVWGLGADKKLLLYRLPDSLQGWTGSDAMPHTAQHNLLAHAKPGYAIVLLPEASILVTGAEDGVLQIRTSVLDPVKPPQKVLEIRMFDGYNGGMTCATVAGGRLFTASGTGLIFSCDAADAGIVKVRGGALARSKDETIAVDPTTKSMLIEGDDTQLSMVEAHEKKLQERSLMAAEAYKNEMKKHISTIRKEFNDVLQKNKEAPELEKLTPQELIVDVDVERSLRKEGEEKVAATHEKVRLEDLQKDILVQHIKTECWSTMAEPGIFIWPFSKGHGVQSFPILVKAGFNTRLSKVARLLRNVEMHEHFHINQVNKAMMVENEKALAQRLSTARSSTTRSTAENMFDGASSRSKATEESKSVGGSSPEVSPAPQDIAPRANQSPSRRGSVVPLIQAEAAAQAAAQQSDKLAEAPVTPSQAVAEVDDDEEKALNLPENGPVANFLYSGYELTTSKRKRLQRLLLHAQLQEIRLGFNKNLSDLQEDKKQRIFKIKEALLRIHDLERALQISDKYVPPGSMVEPPGIERIFTVKNEEICVKKYLNKAERAAAEEQRKLEEEQERIRLGNNWTERALSDMMGGKLEHKVEVIVVEAEIPRPAWMSGNMKKMTKEQIKEIKDFDAKVKAIKEEKEKKIRGQETEMRKLKFDIEELSDGFDNAVADLFSFRLKEEARIASIEESISRLSFAIEQEEYSDEKKELDLAKSLDGLKVTKAASVGAVTEFKREVDAFREQYQNVVEDDKALDRNFKKEFEDLGEFLSQLYRLFRKRQATVAKGDKVKLHTGKDAMSAKSGQKDTTRDGLASPASGPAYQLDPVNDMPEDMEVEQWQRFLRYRDKKIAHEEEVRRMHAHLTTMTTYLDELTAVDDTNRKHIAATLRALTEFRESREKQRRNLELVFHVKAGLVEMELNPLEGDYTDASLMARSIIEEFNELVLQRANVKIDMFVQIKNFKRGIFEVQWDIKKLKMLTRNLIEKVRHLQLLRSTKVLQNVIKTGEDLSLASESAALQNRLEHNETLQKKKIAEKEMHLVQLMRQARLVTRQNVDLQKQAAGVFQEYSFQESLCSSGVAKESKDAALKQRTEGIFNQRRLRELARAQIDYLAFLNKEYERVLACSRPNLPLQQCKGTRSRRTIRTRKVEPSVPNL